MEKIFLRNLPEGQLIYAESLFFQPVRLGNAESFVFCGPDELARAVSFIFARPIINNDSRKIKNQ